jgi:hypothetical protein
MTQKSFRHPVLGEIIGYSSLEEFDAALVAWDAEQAQGDDEPDEPDEPQ